MKGYMIKNSEHYHTLNEDIVFLSIEDLNDYVALNSGFITLEFDEEENKYFANDDWFFYNIKEVVIKETTKMFIINIDNAFIDFE